MKYIQLFLDFIGTFPVNHKISQQLLDIERESFSAKIQEIWSNFLTDTNV